MRTQIIFLGAGIPSPVENLLLTKCFFYCWLDLKTQTSAQLFDENACDHVILISFTKNLRENNQ